MPESIYAVGPREDLDKVLVQCIRRASQMVQMGRMRGRFRSNLERFRGPYVPGDVASLLGVQASMRLIPIAKAHANLGRRLSPLRSQESLDVLERYVPMGRGLRSSSAPNEVLQGLREHVGLVRALGFASQFFLKAAAVKRTLTSPPPRKLMLPRMRNDSGKSFAIFLENGMTVTESTQKAERQLGETLRAVALAGAETFDEARAQLKANGLVLAPGAVPTSLSVIGVVVARDNDGMMHNDIHLLCKIQVGSGLRVHEQPAITQLVAATLDDSPLARRLMTLVSAGVEWPAVQAEPIGEDREWVFGSRPPQSSDAQQRFNDFYDNGRLFETSIVDAPLVRPFENTL